jgi:hypothetical protein
MRRYGVDIGQPRRIIEVEPIDLPIPETLPEPVQVPEPAPVPERDPGGGSGRSAARHPYGD